MLRPSSSSWRWRRDRQKAWNRRGGRRRGPWSAWAGRRCGGGQKHAALSRLRRRLESPMAWPASDMRAAIAAAQEDLDAWVFAAPVDAKSKRAGKARPQDTRESLLKEPAVQWIRGRMGNGATG